MRAGDESPDGDGSVVSSEPYPADTPLAPTSKANPPSTGHIDACGSAISSSPGDIAAEYTARRPAQHRHGAIRTMTRSPADIVEMAERMVLEMLPKRASPQVLAMAAGVSVADLHHAFRAVRGAPLYSALLSVRLEAADRIFRSGASISVEAAATKCGFGHYGVFHRNFRLRFGREPGAVATTVAMVEEEPRSFAEDPAERDS